LRIEIGDCRLRMKIVDWTLLIWRAIVNPQSSISIVNLSRQYSISIVNRQSENRQSPIVNPQ
jgi:hypothetical protein